MEICPSDPRPGVFFTDSTQGEIGIERSRRKGHKGIAITGTQGSNYFVTPESDPSGYALLDKLLTSLGIFP